MASEIKVDTVSEKTSGSGVTIDGLLIKERRHQKYLQQMLMD
jgi:hypothetical protein